jgi:outer membrane protein OmpA-like peptidoglycan-associated protein
VSRDRVTTGLAALVDAVSLFATYGSMAQGVAQQPPDSNAYPIYFATGAYKLEPQDQDTVRGVAAKMAQTPKLTATIVGKADSVGSAEFNEHIAPHLAQEVFEALVCTNKVPEDRVAMRFTGERVPVVSTADEQAERMNRVVAIGLQ